MMSIKPNDRLTIHNHILIALPRKEAERLLPILEHVELPVGRTLSEPGEPITHAYFLNHGAASTVALMEDDRVVEVGVTGNEGMVDIPLLLRHHSVGNRRTYMQIGGDGMRIKAEDLKRQFHGCSPLQNLLLRHTHAYIIQVSQTSACNRAHPVGERLARWLLTTSDRVRSDTLRLTQEFIAEMLGMRRAGVSDVMGELTRRGLIRTSRGKVEIVDRPGLEAASCECYGVVQQEYERLHKGERRFRLPGRGGAQSWMRT
jgi:CRP-like cAMP-binding protein